MSDPADPALYLHIRVIMSMILGLGITRLLNGLAGFAQHPGRQRVWWVHMGWTAWLLLSIIAFWWWEFSLTGVRHWTFANYLFLLLYSSSFFLLCALLFPTDMGEYGGFRDYLMSRRRWFFGTLAVNQLMDVADTLLKGTERLARLGGEYPIRIAVMLALCLAAAWTPSLRWQRAFVIVALLYQVSYVARFYGVPF